MKVLNKGQVTIFIIIALVIVGSIISYFLLKDQFFKPQTDNFYKPVEELFLSCINDNVESGISLLEEQGGYIYLPEFSAGSEFMPSSSQLNFFGDALPFWMYVSGNNIVKEQVPSRKNMENDLETFLNENVKCDFSEYEIKGYNISIENKKSDVKISDDKVDVIINSALEIQFENKSARIDEHKKSVNTKLGKFHSIALRIYNYQKSNMFLEKYGIDVLRLYAPVDGIELSCSPKVWSVQNVENEIKQALEANIMMLKVKGDYYSKDKVDKYFISDIESDEAVQFLYSQNWPTKIDTKNDNGFLISNPVGNQAGLGVIGFCYVPYHFVYDFVFPVLVEVYDEKEMFKFPIVSIIKSNKERNALSGELSETESSVCDTKNANVNVYTYNTDLDLLNADISFQCFENVCDIGSTKNGFLKGKFPQCVNGIVSAKASGYKEAKQIVSTNNEDEIDLILEKIYNVSLILKITNVVNDLAVINFVSEDYSKTVIWPEQKNVELAEGYYNISVQIYKNSSFFIPETKTNKCIKVPQPGLLGIFGAKTEKCFDLIIPSQTLTNVIGGGGNVQEYLIKENLAKGKLEIIASSIPVAKNIEDIQNSYTTLENKKLEIKYEI